jgi:hypothetical protein
MKHLMTLIALVVAVTAGAQGTAIHEYPWNPDWDNDNFVGTSDLTGFLSAFGSEFGNPPEPCTYEGSDFEEFIFGVYDGTIILDSIFVEYEIEDISTYYITGCPDPITDTISFSDALLLDQINVSNGDYFEVVGSSYGYSNAFTIASNFNATTNTYYLFVSAQVLDELGFTDDGFFGGNSSAAAESNLPLPSTWLYDENGMDISEINWNTYGGDRFVNYIEYIHILPYWHYAE